MSNIYYLYALKVVKNNMDVLPLISMGLDYSQISIILDELKKDGYVKKKNNLLILTKKGEELINTLNAKEFQSGGDKWIIPLEQARIPKLDIDEIYLPRKKKKL